MKTGRVRSKEEAPAAEAAQEAVQEAAPAVPSAVQAGGKPAVAEPAPIAGTAPGNKILWVFIAVVAVIACIVLFTLLRGGGAEEWVPASRVTGDWTAGVQVFAPQAQIRNAWQTDCQNSQGVVQEVNCVLRATGQFADQPSDTYDEYAFNLYWEETWNRVYEAQGINFVVGQLGGDEGVTGGRRFVTQERIKADTCRQTEYTVWVDDPQDASQEQEVYLFDCEVWNHVTVYDPVEALWCPCEVTSLVSMGTQSSEGTGLSVAWPQVVLPSGGQTEQSFSGRVTFVAGDYAYTATTSDPQQYKDYLSGQYYIAIRKGRPIAVSRTPSR